MPHDDVTGLSRRQILRRGVAVGTAVWTVPTVTAITLTPANAASPSGEPPTEPPKPPTEPPKPPTEPPSNETTPPPSTETTPPPSNETTPPGTSTPSGKPRPPGDEDEDETTAGGLPNTGPGDVAQGLAVGGLLTAAGAAMYVASRKESPAPGDAEPGAAV
ncbi:LPXTG cell wall anchor domain-containing protein [Jiangella alba]|uniref:LPXTG cell wall anchor domain-containing protein n=1 Tax=Jiangella alba TaxID=561176 RepID=UPI00083F2BF6|nr:LPXTG cell wall anchor domain-containing protein [Jiangella alba]